jgi:amidohydrolase
MSSSAVTYRRALHRIPETDNDLPETMTCVEQVLTKLPCKLFSPIRSSLCAWFDAGKSETVAFRADMDALPVTEETGLPYASVHSGKMHACGHDGHTAMMLELAEYVGAHLSELPRNVLFLFQPSEETTGGAKQLCEAGIFEKYRVRRVFGLHLWPELAAGEVYSRPGPLMARCNEIHVTLTGRSVHISKYREGVDALAVGAEYLRRVYAMVDQIPPEEPFLLRFGQMVSGTVCNVLSGKTVLDGCLRTYSETMYSFCRRQLSDIAKALSEETGCAIDVQLSDGYPAVWNHEALYGELCGKLGADAPRLLSQPALAAEDFSFYQQYAPGVFFLLGVGNTSALHAPTFAFDDEAVLPQGVSFLKKLLLMS